MPSPINVDDFRMLARRRLPRRVFDYLDGGAEDERGLRRNRAAFERLAFVPRRLADVGTRELSTTLLGTRLAAPFVIAPTGLNGLIHPDGDLALARAARRAGIPFAMSTASNVSLERLAGEAGGELWFQLYVMHRELADSLVQRAARAGYRTLVVTVDVPLNGKRERDLRNGFALPLRCTPGVLLDGLLHPRWWYALLRGGGLPTLANLGADGNAGIEAKTALLRRQMDASFGWDDLRRLRERWPHRLLVKGILHTGDAVACLEAGADGLILSNHGARQLDDAVAPLDVLSAARQACGARGALLVDSGVRRGSDVVKALALGANAVMLGRAALYGLAAAGEAGVTRVLEILRDEVDRTLAMLGCRGLAELSASHLAPAAPAAPAAPGRQRP
ncbi:alpha-hydroxy-acid oxidizing protein [Burkholderia glumae]|uniref:alpha-hydroxy-acid oxidizing protein n=2 Tax=Burkholderia glumae TaxID=337 RepID=UPI000C27EF1C|nr:alpha-hydroxy-acid oxidizing protein [Burkholderia glumae]MCM2493643.1 alpha-hydroxy-acid oxidizing protein [Burkholderia glumae]MCM2543736.1 alpha-hydroxy-acid oxidizing protein [Burkholderia glumae]PJO22358.1 mandelate dehydrogenase [Burkholderia glumae AU6208]QHE09384.1 mandelate dehydrogenase [Burkholderia glumae AU6208]